MLSPPAPISQLWYRKAYKLQSLASSRSKRSDRWPSFTRRFLQILNRLLASLASEGVSFSKLGDLIEKDTVLSGNVLQLVNSSLYGRRGTVNSVRHALSLLGINKLRNAVLGVSITRMWNRVGAPQSWSMARFNPTRELRRS